MLAVLTAGAVAGLAAERYAIGRGRRRADPEVAEAFGRLPGRVRTVLADDGVPLHVEEVDEAPRRSGQRPTVVFCHGYTLHLACWHYQRRDLADVARLVFWDQRSHGRSGRAPAASCTIDQLGRDLAAILRAVDASGPVVLVGHSMGGMTIMALADQQPQLFGPAGPIVGVALLGTSPGKLGQVSFGLPAVAGRVTRRVLPWLSRGATWRPDLIERGRRLGTDLGYVLTRTYSFGSRDVSPAVVDFVEQMVSATPVEVIAAFYPTFGDHDKLGALEVLRDVETLVLVGDRDLVTPPDHSRQIAAALPAAELVTVSDAGHLAMLERPTVVNLHLRSWLRRATRHHPDVAASVAAAE